MRHAHAPRTAAAALAALLLWPAAGAAQDEAACSLAASSYADAILNPPRGEDTDFFVTSGGVPNVVFLIGSSASMVRLPPDGAATGWGSFQDSSTTFGCVNPTANDRVFRSSCGTTTVEGQQYSSAVVWAEAKDSSGRYCGYFDKAGQPLKTDKPGYDPDFYPTFFTGSKVYHEAVVAPDGSRDGWTSTGTSPQPEASVANFCARASWTAGQQASCAACMADRGYWFDGSYLPWVGPSCGSTLQCRARGYGTCVQDANGLEWNGANDNTAHCRIPNVWMSGNFLNFYPPKFVIARKVTKDILAGVKLFRLGVVSFDGTGDGMTLVSGLNPPCNLFGSSSAFFNDRNAVKTKIDAVKYEGPAPLAESLLDVAAYYASGSLPWFPAPYTPPHREQSGQNVSVCFACQKSSVLMLSDGSFTRDGNIPGVAGWSPTTQSVADTTGNYAGMSGYNIDSISTTDCPVCETAAELPDSTIPAGACDGQQLSGACGGSPGSPITAWLPRVAWYVHNMDLRVNSENGKDGYKMAGKQVLDVYPIGIGVRGNDALVLRHAAEAGGGLYNGGSGLDSVVDASELKRAIEAALDDVTTRALAFGTASLSTLQAAASQSVLVPRFTPSRKAHWHGHLYAFDLWSEFTGGCTVPTSGTSGPANGDHDCDGRCTSVFLRDREGDFIMENSTGAFMKNDPKGAAACGYGNKCSPCAKPHATDRAIPYWDAGDKLSPLDADGKPKAVKDHKDWDERSIYTVVDDAAPAGRFTPADTLVRLGDDDATVARLLPYLNVRGNDSFCGAVADQLDAQGNPVAWDIRIDLGLATPTYLPCAKVLVQYLMGADVFNERGTEDPLDPGCAGYPMSYCTRPYQLGDVFHSSPVEVWPPLSSDGLLCVRGLHPQCLPSLFSGSIANPSASGNQNAYDDYAKSARYKHRNKFALFGANDGMLHAIVTGRWQAGKDDPKTPQREDQDPYEGYHDVGTGEEIWAFIPPDLLAKVPLFLGSTHHYFVDGTPMVRDVWIDGGQANRMGGAAVPNGVREGNEFHTVAVVGERRGGTKYFALEVTDAGDDLEARPRFLWLYPQPDDPEHLSFGETFAEFVPTPPPMGPVRIDSGAPPCANPNHREFQTSTGAGRCFEERWVVMLSGGFDLQYTKGRGVHMVDLATGEEIWDFSQPKGAASGCDASKDPRCHLNYPVAAPVGMMMWGKETNFLSAAAVDGYFDTATFGDTGGQLWVLRFSDPGRRGTDGRVTNWYGARIFQMSAPTAPASGVDFCGSQPFFHITANLPLRANGLYRVLAGTGDRFNLLDQAGGVCSPDNLRACILKGCTVKIDDGSGGPGALYGVETLVGTDAYHMTHNAACGSFDPSTYTATQAGGGGGACSSVVSKIDKVEITCPATAACSGSAEVTRKQISIACAGGHCRPGSLADPGRPIDLDTAADKRNWYFSALVFESAGNRRIFADQAGAIAYDAARLSEADLVTINEYDASPATKPLADPGSRGWKYYFDHGAPNTADTLTIDSEPYRIWRADERVASTSAVEASCAFWNTLQVAVPEGAFLDTSCPVRSPCKAGKKQVSYLYGANPGTGGLCLYVDGIPSRAQQTESIVPPHIGKLVAYVSSGQVSFGLTSVRIPQGGSNISLGEAQDVTSLVEWIPIDKDLEKCRHAPKGTPPAECK
jgi:type IV pilus assembly protein PilY1